MPTPTLDTNRVDIEAIVRDFAASQPAESFFCIPPDFSVATGDVFESPQGYFFALDQWFTRGEYGANCLDGSLQLARLAVARDVEMGGVVLDTAGERVVTVCGFEEMNTAVAQAVLDVMMQEA